MSPIERIHAYWLMLNLDRFQYAYEIIGEDHEEHFS